VRQARTLVPPPQEPVAGCSTSAQKIPCTLTWTRRRANSLIPRRNTSHLFQVELVAYLSHAALYAVYCMLPCLEGFIVFWRVKGAHVIYYAKQTSFRVYVVYDKPVDPKVSGVL
jgi:hypothetical protein